MESMKDALKRMTGDRPFLTQVRHLFEEMKKTPGYHQLQREHPALDDKTAYRHLAKVREYLDAANHCANCPGLDKCPQALKGYAPAIQVAPGNVTVSYHPCHLKEEADRKKDMASLINSMYVPRETLRATFQDMDLGAPGRMQAVEAVLTFVEQYLANPSDTRGLYLHGSFGIGKTYLMGAMMNELAKRKGIASLMVYTPDFFREMKQAISENKVNEKLERVKKVPVLILDDIGAETLTPWIRDDVLGSILQYRMMEGLPTHYTSNFDLDELSSHLAQSKKSGNEYMKAMRLMQRIKPFVNTVGLKGQNRRE